jgi:hypothetical protein
MQLVQNEESIKAVDIETNVCLQWRYSVGRNCTTGCAAVFLKDTADGDLNPGDLPCESVLSQSY